MGRYRIQESVGSTLQPVHTYEDLEIHHPSQRGREPGRVYATIEGEREEVLRQKTGQNHFLISKDFILLDSETGSSRVPVPSPVSGYVGKVDQHNGLVAILDRKGGELIAQVRHMDLRGSVIREGQHVEYGQPLGLQSGFGRGKPRAYGTHVHVDINEKHLEQFKKYIRDLDSGVIEIGVAPEVAWGKEIPRESEASHEPARTVKAGDSGAVVLELQTKLAKLGYRDASGRVLKLDGNFGRHTDEAVRVFQERYGLHADGVVGRDTREALAKAEKMPLLSELPHPDHRLFDEARARVRELPLGSFRSESELDRAAGALTSTASSAGLSRVDHVMLNTRGDRLIGVQGNLQDPDRHVVSIDKAQAISQSLQQSTAQLAEQRITQDEALKVRVQIEQMEHRNGLVVGGRP